jgi:drug/metabolite transporter (DMT)-like permease
VAFPELDQFEKMTPQATLIWLLNISFETFGQLSFKAAATASKNEGGVERWQIMLKNKWIWAGIFCYVIEFFLYIAFLSLVPLSQGVLLGSFNILAVMIGGRLLFKETITTRRAIAIGLISLGVGLVGWA